MRTLTRLLPMLTGVMVLLVTPLAMSAGAGNPSSTQAAASANAAAPAAAPHPGEAAPAGEAPASSPGDLPTSNPALDQSASLIASPNLLAPPAPSPNPSKEYRSVLDRALKEKRSNNLARAESLFVSVLEADAPAEDQKTAMLQLAVLAHEQQQWAKAQQIYAQFLSRYLDDPDAPEVLLRQGLLYRQMGAPVMALSKFYSVMSTALHLKSDRLDQYQRVVLQAQSEIAETYYLQGKFDEAADYFGRLLKLDNASLDKTRILYKLIRCLSVRGRSSDLVSEAERFLDRYPDAEPAAEIRFLLADALKRLGRNREAMEQVKALLESQQRKGTAEWAYWQQRAGNEIANQLYREGDYLNALEVYQSLATLNRAPEWQLPALYQVGLVYERLQQPEKALEAYRRILNHGELGTNTPPASSLATVLDMAKWRAGYLDWHRRAGELTHRVVSSPQPGPDSSP